MPSASFACASVGVSGFCDRRPVAAIKPAPIKMPVLRTAVSRIFSHVNIVETVGRCSISWANEVDGEVSRKDLPQREGGIVAAAGGSRGFARYRDIGPH